MEDYLLPDVEDSSIFEWVAPFDTIQIVEVSDLPKCG